MKPVPSTAEILMCKVLDHDIDKMWIDWAVEMMMVGFETEALLILAGIELPENQFYLQDLTTKVLSELQLDYSNKEQTIKNYVCLLIERSLKGQVTYASCLGKLKDLYYLSDERFLTDFMLLYWAQDDLNDSEDQWYWTGADRSDIDQIITDHFLDWLAEHQ